MLIGSNQIVLRSLLGRPRWSGFGGWAGTPDASPRQEALASVKGASAGDRDRVLAVDQTHATCLCPTSASYVSVPPAADHSRPPSCIFE